MEISLRRIEYADLGKLFEWRNDPRIMKWTRQHMPLHMEDHIEWYEWQRKDTKTEMFAVDADGLAGVAGLTDIDMVNRRAEFSLYIDPDQHGKGLGESSLRGLLRYGFRNINLNSIWGEAFEKNPAMYLFRKVGMTQTGFRRSFYYRNGRYLNAHMFGILKSEFIG